MWCTIPARFLLLIIFSLFHPPSMILSLLYFFISLSFSHSLEFAFLLIYLSTINMHARGLKQHSIIKFILFTRIKCKVSLFLFISVTLFILSNKIYCFYLFQVTKKFIVFIYFSNEIYFYLFEAKKCVFLLFILTNKIDCSHLFQITKIHCFYLLSWKFIFFIYFK